MRLYTCAVFALGGVAGSSSVIIPDWPGAVAVLLALLILALAVADMVATDLSGDAP